MDPDEAQQINHSLACLDRCLEALGNMKTQGRQRSDACRQPSYHQSQLTRLLEPVLQPQSRIVVLQTLSPAAADTAETLQSLVSAQPFSRVVEAEAPGEAGDAISATKPSQARSRSASVRKQISDLEAKLRAAQSSNATPLGLVQPLPHKEGGNHSNSTSRNNRQGAGTNKP